MTARTFENKAMPETTKMTMQPYNSTVVFVFAASESSLGFEPEMYETFERKSCKSCGGKSNYEPWRITIIKLSMYMLPTKSLNCSVTVLTFSFETKDSRTRSFDRHNCGTCMRAHLSTFQQPSSSQEQRKTDK